MACSGKEDLIDGVIRSIQALFNDSGDENTPKVLTSNKLFFWSAVARPPDTAVRSAAVAPPPSVGYFKLAALRCTAPAEQLRRCVALAHLQPTSTSGRTAPRRPLPLGPTTKTYLCGNHYADRSLSPGYTSAGRRE